jgi:hypothetical protein
MVDAVYLALCAEFDWPEDWTDENVRGVAAVAVDAMQDALQADGLVFIVMPALEHR